MRWLSFSIFALDAELFLFGQVAELAGVDATLHPQQVVDPLLDRGPVGERAAQPALVDVRHAAAVGFLLHRGLGLAFGADKQDRAALGDGVLDKLGVLVQAQHSLLQVDDMDAAALGENVRAHLGVPPPSAMPEVDAGL